MAILLGIGVVHVLPIWSLTYFPSQDGPSHIYNAHAFLQLFDQGNWRLDQFFRQNIGWIPNSLAHLFFVAGQGLGFAPLLVEKVFITLVILALPLSMHYVATALDPKNWLAGLMGLVLAFHNLLHLGFYSYSASVPLALIFLGAFLRWRADMTLGRMLSLLMLGQLVFLAHFSSMAVLLVLLACVMVMDFFGACFRWIKKERTDLPSMVAWIKNGVLLFGVGSPALVYHLMASRPGSGGFMGHERLLTLLFQDALLVTYTADHQQVTLWFWWLTGLAFVCHLILRLVRMKLWEKTDLFGGMAVALLWLYLALPNETHGGSWANHRPLLFLLIFIWLSMARFPAWLQAILGALILYLSLHQLILFDRDYRMLQPMLEEYRGVADRLDPHSTLAVKRESRNYPRVFPNVSRNVDPFLHAPCYAAMGKDVVYVKNYEADYRYFWVNHRERGARPKDDHLLIWKLGDVPIQDAAGGREDYETVLDRPHLSLLRLKRPLAGTGVAETLKFRFSQGIPGDGTQVIPINQPWSPGRSGFMDTAGLQLRDGGVRSPFSNTLRLELPGGRYRVNLLLRN